MFVLCVKCEVKCVMEDVPHSTFHITHSTSLLFAREMAGRSAAWLAY